MRRASAIPSALGSRFSRLLIPGVVGVAQLDINESYLGQHTVGPITFGVTLGRWSRPSDNSNPVNPLGTWIPRVHYELFQRVRSSEDRTVVCPRWRSGHSMLVRRHAPVHDGRRTSAAGCRGVAPPAAPQLVHDRLNERLVHVWRVADLERRSPASFYITTSTSMSSGTWS